MIGTLPITLQITYQLHYLSKPVFFLVLIAVTPKHCNRCGRPLIKYLYQYIYRAQTFNVAYGTMLLFQVSNNLSHMYSEMIFKHGFVHCDPHPGNVLVRKTSRHNAQIVLLDHGLYTVSKYNIHI